MSAASRAEFKKSANDLIIIATIDTMRTVTKGGAFLSMRPFKTKSSLELTFRIFALIAFLVAPAASWAQTLKRGDLARNTPRSTVQGFLEASRAGDFHLASEYLDLSQVENDQGQNGPRLAYKLKVVLDRQLWIDLSTLSAENEGERNDGLPDNRESIGSIELNGTEMEVLLSRHSLEGSEPIWQFAASSVSLTPKLYEEYGDGPIASLLPQPLTALTFLEIRLWQWLGVIFFLVLSFVTGWIAAFALVQVVRPVVRKSKSSLDDKLLSIVTQPIRLLITTGIFSLSLGWLYLSVPAEKALKGLAGALAVAGFIWLTFRFVDLLADGLNRRFKESGRAVAGHFLPLSARILKVVLGAIAILASLESLGFDVTALIAGLGVGGLAVALAAQKTLENIFGGVTVLLDQPVKPGDFCRFGDNVGTVEEIGLRSTRVRTLERTIISIPNAEFASLQLENFADRDRILVRTTLGLRYETTADQLRYVMIELRKMLYSHPRIAPEPTRVRLVGFGGSSVDLELYCYVQTNNWEDYLAVREDVFLRIMGIVDQSGTGFAFPSQTTYLSKDSGNDPQKTEDAEASIAALRASGQMPLPEFTKHERNELKGQLDYPLKGSSE